MSYFDGSGICPKHGKKLDRVIRFNGILIPACSDCVEDCSQAIHRLKERFFNQGNKER